MQALVIIPARYDSTRLPGKPLVDVHGKPMIRHVYERASEAPGIEAVVVATDDERVAEAVHRFGGRSVMTSRACPSGTDRVAEAARRLEREGLAFDAVVNVQGDEPGLDPAAVGLVASLLDESPSEGRAPMATLARPLSPEEQDDPGVVKVVVGRLGHALYFSRAPLGRDRDDPSRTRARAHVGLYAYTRGFLDRFTRLSPTPLEQAERLEQLRALEHGLPIAVGHTSWRARGIDTPADLDRFRASHL